MPIIRILIILGFSDESLLFCSVGEMWDEINTYLKGGIIKDLFYLLLSLL